MPQDIPNIVVLVGGTVDPGNMDAVARSLSYPKPSFQSLEEALKNKDDKNWYWLGNDHFVLTLDSLRKKYNNLHVFTAHGWTGDNSVQARMGAGAYLANRLCGAQGEPPYYEAHLHKPVHFHFIGHSHGGNVINELTRQAAKVWPKQWKIRSITYLSTPFFTKLHQVDTAAFHDDCQVINVFCRYDITQRVIADFSLHPMTGLMNAVGVDEIGCIARCLAADLGSTRKLFMELVNSLDVSFLKEGTRWGELKTVKSFTDGVSLDDFQKLPRSISEDIKKVDVRVAHYGKAEATRFYTHVLAQLSRLYELFTKLRAAVTLLKEGLTYDVHKSVDPSKKKTRTVLSGPLAAQFIRELNLLEGGLRKTQAAFTARLSKGRFPLTCIADDLYVTEFLKPLITFLEVNPQTLQGPLWDLLVRTLAEQIDVYDNTRASPEFQLTRKVNSQKKAFPLVQVDVTQQDDYSKATGQQGVFNQFINRLAGIEAQLEGKALSGAKRPLLDLLFTLLAHMEPVRVLITDPDNAKYVSWFEFALTRLMLWKKKWGLGIDFELQLLRLSGTAQNYGAILKSRNFGQLQVPEKKPALRVRVPSQPEAPLDCACGKHASKALPATQAAKPHEEERPPAGSIPYLAMVAHSTSRMSLYPEVKTALERQFTTKRR